MDDLVLCGASAFAYYRIPPQILGFYPPLVHELNDSTHVRFGKSPLIADALGTPLHRLVENDGRRHKSKLYKSHTIKYGLPFGSLRKTDHGFWITSPAATLLTMAANSSREDVLMAAYEMTGSFAVFNPNEKLEEQLQSAGQQNLPVSQIPWKRVMNVDGQGTNLWRRPSVLTVKHLEKFCMEVAGFHGIKKLQWAMSHITGKTASPFEAQASMLLGLPRVAGGEGLSIKNNQRIRLTRAAQSLYPHVNCYADILVEGKEHFADVIIECQGRSVHASEAAGISDSNRATALAHMGYEVVFLTYEQITNKRAFDAVLDIVAQKTGNPRKPKTARQIQAEDNLRREIFTDWSALGR